MFYVYILKSLKTGSYYIGQTRNISERINVHNQGRNRSTKSGRPWQLIYKEAFEMRRDAIRRERNLKSLKKRRSLERLTDHI